MTTALALLLPALRAGQVAASDRPDSLGVRDTLLLAVRLERLELDGLVPALAAARDTLLPLGELCRALGLGVRVDAAHGIAAGFMISERRDFHLDVMAGRARSGRMESVFDPARALVGPGEIYVPRALLSSWLDAAILLDPRAATLFVKGSEPLPIEAQYDRRVRARRLDAAAGDDHPVYPRLQAPRRLWSGPFVDQSFRSTSIDGPLDRSESWEYSGLATAEVLGLDGDLRWYGNRARSIANVAGGIGRSDPDPVLLGPLGARQVRAGELTCPALDLITLASVGPGFVVSSFPLEQPDRFDRQTLSGPLPPGWEVELYRDDGLIAYQASHSDGTYTFQDVALTFGANRFRLIFHGPNGERRTETRVFNVGRSLIPQGEHYYRLAWCNPISGGPRSYLESSFGLGRGVSAACAVAQLGRSGEQQYATGGLRTSWSRLFASADAAVDRRGATAFEGAAQSLCGPVTVSLRHALLMGFESEAFRPILGETRTRTTTRLAGALPIPGITIPFEAEATIHRLVSGESVRLLSNRIGFALPYFSLSHSMRILSANGDSLTDLSESRNALLLGTRVRRCAVRAALEYLPRERDWLRSVDVTAEGATPWRSFAGVGANWNPALQEARWYVAMRQDQGPVGWNVRTEHGRRSGTVVSLGVTMGLDHDPRGGRWYAHAQPVAGTGAVSARVFLDANGNGRFDADEQPIEGSRFSVDRVTSAARTGTDGIAYMPGLPAGQPINLSLSTESLEDPLWLPQRPGLTVVPRPGRTELIDFPVTATGEVVGTVRIRELSVMRPVPGAEIELIDARTEQIVRTTSAIDDGSYDIPGVLPGRYVVRVASEWAARLGLVMVRSSVLEIRSEGTTLDGVDLILDITPRTSGRED